MIENNNNNNIDDELYERFVTEVINGIESRNNTRGNNSINTTTSTTLNNSRSRRGDLYARILRNLLYIDYLFMLITLPMTLYTIFNTVMHLITFDFSNSDGNDSFINSDDIYQKLQTYFNYVKVEENIMPKGNNNNNNNSKFGEVMYFLVFKLFSSVRMINSKLIRATMEEYENKLNEMDIIDSLGLLGKFHKVVKYYTRSFEKIKFYPLIVKSLTTIFYLSYGFIGSSYVILLNIFFMLCLILTLFRRYQDIAEIIIKQFW